MAQPRIGFIGIGMMGHGIAINLVRKGFALTFRAHRDRSRLADLLAGGAREAATAAEVGRESDVVIFCVTGSPQVEENVFGVDGRGGLLETVREGQIVIDTSTSEPGSTARTREALARKGATLVDAPLGRTPREAEEGRLTTMVGATDAVFERVKPVLAAFCEHVFHVGPPGAGHTLKLVNNFMALTIAASIGEAFAVAARAGVKLDRLVEVASQSAYNSNIFQLIARGAVEGDLTRMKFSIVNAAKDLRYYTHLAESLPVPAFIGEAVHQSYQQAVALGLGERLLASMIEAQEKLGGAPILER
jgi:3-hydroxyisobutyrate dehydrogenase-like beta-hydroxyacid dehydrogenase